MEKVTAGVDKDDGDLSVNIFHLLFRLLFFDPVIISTTTQEIKYIFVELPIAMKIRESERAFFPINSLNEFVNLVENHILFHEEEGSEPNLVFLSILFGYLEHELTLSRFSASDHTSEVGIDVTQTKASAESSQATTKNTVNTEDNEADFPSLDFEIVEGLCEHFSLLIKSHIDKSLTELTTRSGYATKLLCKRVSDVIWNGLLRSYHKDKAHIQSLFSYLTGQQLDCFGLAFVVVAACQVLNYKDVHLVISGDHAWAACGEDSKEMVEVTWHGRGSEDRRGYSIDESVTDKSWIYHGGKPVKCNRWMEFVALLVSLNPSIDLHTDSDELLIIQHKILKSLYKRGHLDEYPMALGLFCELEESLEICDSDLDEIHNQALMAVQVHYDDLHILPYCSKGRFCLRQGRHREAMKCWAKAAEVASRYNYGKEDEEIYKEMIDIANELIPQALKEDPSLCESADCYCDVLKFYDGICLWEEDSSTPILHSWWARYFTLAVGRFFPHVRESVQSDDKSNSCNEEEISVSPSEEDHVTESQSAATDQFIAVSTPTKADTPCKKPELTSPNVILSSNGERDHNKPEIKTTTKLHLYSHKMKALRDMLTNGKKINSQAVGLLLTAQSQVHFVKRRSNVGDYSMEYGNVKRVRRSRDFST